MKAQRSYSDVEIAHYVLGLDLGDQGRDIETLLAHDDAAAARALKWETYLLGIVDALPPLQPPDSVLLRVRQTLGMTAGDGAPAVAQEGAAAPGHDRQPGAVRWGGRLGRWLSVSHRRRMIAVLVVSAVVLIAGAAAITLWAYTHPPTPTVVHEAVPLAPAAPHP